LLHPEVSPSEEHPPLNNSFIVSMVLSSQLHKYLPSKRGSSKSRGGIFELPIKNSIGLSRRKMSLPSNGYEFS
jgi:hypothetical protein